jgi:hypothetical protein
MSIQDRNRVDEDFEFAAQFAFNGDEFGDEYEGADLSADLVDPFDFRGYVSTLLVCGWVATAIVASHSWAYVVDPQAAGISALRSSELYVFWAAWILLCAGPVVAVIWSQYRSVWSWFIPTIAILWPATLFAIHATLNFEFGNWYLGYLSETPVMWVTDVVIPAVLLFAHFRTQRQCRSLNS